MGKVDFKKIVGSVRTSISKHSPEILTGIGIAGMLTTTVLAVKATPKALALIESEKKRQQAVLYEEADKKGSDKVMEITKLKPIDVVKVTWKCYIPSALIGVSSVACLIGASAVHTRRNAVLATAYKLSETALTEYKTKVIETIGEKKEQTIRESIDKDRIDKNPVSNNEVFITEKGNTLCYDHTSGRYFKSDIEKIKKATNEINAKLLRESYVSLNDFYDELGLPGMKLGNELGWSSETGLIELYFSSQISEDGTPCLVIDYKVPPKYDYDKFC